MTEANHEIEPLLRAGGVDESPSVYPVIHMIKSDVIHFIDTPLTFEALTAPDLTYTLVRPLTEKYVALQNEGNLSVVFCLLINRVRFRRDENISTHAISRSRSELCEILATRVFREMANNTLHLAIALTTSWPVYSGADPDVIAQAREDRDDDLEERVGNAIEMAILGKAKRFIKSSACQKVIDGIWSGKCVYQAQSSHSILSDTYKRTPIHFYDPHKAPLLDHYRLKVPAIRSVLEYTNFLILFVLFIVAIEFSERDKLNPSEMLFMVYALGFTLEKFAAMQEHGIEVYFKGTWNGFDLAFITAYLIYAILRVYGIYHDSRYARSLGTDVLALIACLMFPRLAFVTFKDNLMVLSLRAMILQFVSLMVIAAFCFCGFLYALWTLSRDEAGYGAGLISWWMLDLWFGLDAAGFDNAANFHPIFGPILMVTYACLSNTLLLTVLVSILSNTFASVNEDAAAEAMFRKAVSTIEGVKADSLFSYQPPVNLVAVLILLPSSYVLSPRWFHKLNVFMIRLTSFPVLIAISLYERQLKRAGRVNLTDTVSNVADRVFDTLPKYLKRMTIFEGFAGAEADIHAVFEIEQEYESALDTHDNNDGFSLHHRRVSSGSTSQGAKPFPTASPTKPIPPRMRLPSVMHVQRPDAHYASPLAQVFNPLLVEEEPSEETSGSAGLSYGPITRRRLTSTVLNKRQSPEQPTHVHAVEMKKFPSLGANVHGHSPPTRDIRDIRRSRSQDHRRSQVIGSQEQRSSPQPIQTAGEIKAHEAEDGTGNGIPIGVLERLEGMEKRQERIESLLQQISNTLNTPSST